MMNINLHGAALALGRAQTLALNDAFGTVANVRSGCLWITLEKDPRDIVLRSGDTWTIDRNGRTVVVAGRPSTVVLTEPVPTSLDWRSALRRVAGLARAVLRAPEQVPYY